MKIVPHNKPTFGPEEESAVRKVLQSGWVAQGAEVEHFENEFCDFLGLPHHHAVALSSGTAALYMALWALNAKSKEVAFPVYACSALRNAVALTGATERIFDTAENSPNIDLAKVKDRAPDIVIVAHLFGLPADIPDMGSTAVIEDCAQSLGATTDGKHTSPRGRAAVYSFYATKLMTTGGQGGMIVSADRSLVDAVRDYREFDQRRDKKTRFNFQMTDLQAAIGREQLKKLPLFLRRRQEIFNRYADTGIPLLDTKNDKSKKFLPVRYRAVMQTAAQREVISSLAKKGIKAIVPVEDWELLGNPAEFPSAMHLSRNTVSLPIYPLLSDKDVDSVVATVKHL